jgi:hypothetical protein
MEEVRAESSSAMTFQLSTDFGLQPQEERTINVVGITTFAGGSSC